MTPEQARAELARRELAKRQQPVVQEEGGRFRGAGADFSDIFPRPAQTVSREVTDIKQAAGLVKTGGMPVSTQPGFGLISTRLPGGFLGGLRKELPRGISEPKYITQLREIHKGPGTEQEKDEAARTITNAEISDRVSLFQRAVQSPHTQKEFQDEAEELKGKFLSKTYRRWERGSTMIVGGGAHLAEELTRLATLGKYGNTAGDYAKMYHDVLNRPEMVPVVENVIDRYVGGAVEIAPYIIAALAPAALTGGAAIPSFIAGFLTSYAVEGNNAYQSARNRGESERLARIRGIAVGLINGGVEVSGGSGGKYFKSRNAAIKAVTTKLGKAKIITRNVLENALKEGLREELPQEAISMIVGGDVPRRTDGSVDLDAVVSRLVDSAIMGTIVGGLVSAPISTVDIYKLSKRLSARPDVEAGIPQVVGPTEQPINVYKTVSGSRTGITEQEVTREGERYVDSVTGEDVILDQATSGSALTRPTRPIEPGAVETKPLKTPTPGEMQTKADEIHKTIGDDKTKVRLRAEPRSEKELLWRGHALPEALGLDEDSRRDLMQEIVGKRSMKELSPQERELFVSYLEGLAGQSGVEIEKPVIERAIERLTAISKKQKKLTPTEETHPELHRTWLEKISQDIKGWSSEAYHELMRIERFLESLDGEENGVLYENIWKLTKAADELAIDKTFMGFEEFLQVMEENGFDPALTMGKVEKISPGVELTRMQQIGVYNKSKNENGLRYLREGMGISDADIAKISNGLTDAEKKLADWYLEKWRAYWPLIVKVADSIGMDVDKLEQEFNYSTLIRTDIDPSEEVELTDTLTDQFTQESFKPKQGFLEKRKKRAVGKIELDEAVSYLTSMRRIERFLAMAPVAKKVGAILRNREFKSALNDATYGHGVKLLNTWMQDSIRGYVSEDAGRWNKMLSILRRNAAVYAIGWNIPSVFRQTLALFNAAAVNPLMLKYIPINTAKATRNFGKLEKEVLEKSALVRTMDIDRDVRRRWDRETIGKRLRGKDPFDKKSLAWLKWMNHRTWVVGWKSLYETAIEKNKTEKEAVEYADKWIGRTQEMGGAKDLPHFFRGGTFNKIITTFENQVNNQFNFYAYDIIEVRRRGDISNTEVAYRVMFSHILPAILMGMIGRGGLPKTWKQLLTDVVTYPIASLMLIGRLINRTITGFSNSTSIVEAGPEAVGQAAQAAVKGDVRKFITEAAKAVGAITGKVPAQIIRTIGGAYDLATGDTKDPRRLMWSEWALEEGKKKSVTPPRRPPTRPPARRPPTRRPG